MTPQERARLTRALVAMDDPHPLDYQRFRRRERLFAVIVAACCVVLAAWIGVLAVTLPRQYAVGGWRAAWLGFDGALLGAFIATAWTAWRGRQVVIVCLIVTATLLCCDAWFDLTLDWGTREFPLSLASALVAEVPLAFFAIFVARRLLRLSILVARVREGYSGPVPSLWRLALFGIDQAATHAADHRQPPGLQCSGLTGLSGRRAGACQW